MTEDTLQQIEGNESAPAPQRPETPRQRAKQYTKLNKLLEDAYWMLQELSEEKQEDFDERSECWQDSEKGEAARVELELLEDASTHIEEAQGSLAALVG